ncbi:kinesin-related protein 4-like [Penaeus japonicus]|uniref:kinesin-related protein 4-like n=1 Tax=Penaeus japonicus TaxID=27405 RepID=UPI001C70B34D|nr:kinesin-related protein 4-like [Penaeus japonicus]XP_042856765.1 kinesin-related protein 4-like [Penaeus japonicus]
MITFATVSVVSSLLLWTVYHNFLIDFNSQQMTQHSSDWEDISPSARSSKLRDISEKVEMSRGSPKSAEAKSNLNALKKDHQGEPVTDSSSSIGLSEVQKVSGGRYETFSDPSENKVSLESDKDSNDDVNYRPESSVESSGFAQKDNADDIYESEDSNVHDITIYDNDEIDRYDNAGNDEIQDNSVFEDKTEKEDTNGIQDMTEKSITQDLHEEVDRSPIQDSTEKTNATILDEIHKFTDDLLNISDNVFKLIVESGSQEITTGHKNSNKNKQRYNQQGRSTYGNSAGILYSLASYIFHMKDDKPLEISAEQRINTENLDILEPSVDKIKDPANTPPHLTVPAEPQEEKQKINPKMNPNEVQFPSSTPKPKVFKEIIKVGNIRRVKTEGQDDFLIYFRGLTWEVFVTLAAVVVGLLLLLMVTVVWVTQHLRKRETRKRLLRIQSGANQQAI